MAAALNLHIDALKAPDTEGAPKKRKLASLVDKAQQFTSSAGSGKDSQIPQGYTPEEWKLFQLLNNFLQPGSDMSLKDATNCAVDVFPKNYTDMRSLNYVCTELAEQIPYDHPSQLKLARFLWSMGRSDRRILNSGLQDPAAAAAMFYQDLWEDVEDNIRDPGDDGADPARYVNYQAFLANITDIGIWLPGSKDAVWALHSAFAATDRGGERDAAAVHKAWVLGAAQWILWFGQGLFKQVLCPDHPHAHDTARVEGGRGDIRASAPGYATLRQWTEWKRGFTAFAGLEGTGHECGRVASKAADMMEVLEKGMSEVSS